jgi:nucleoside-diphosphate-sugar epimerase
MNCYALSKVAGEQAADYFVARYDMAVLSFRLMGVRTPERIAGEIERMAGDPASGSSLLWTRTDVRDAAMACRLAVEQDEVCPGPYNITGAEVVLSRPSRSLVAEHFGDRTEVRDGLSGQASPLSCARAEAAFGYRPRYVWTEDRQFPE